jgi:hypothetical protein
MALRRSKEQPRIDGRSGEHLGSPSARYSQPKRRPQSDPKNLEEDEVQGSSGLTDASAGTAGLREDPGAAIGGE